MAISPAIAYQKMINDTENFLRKYPIRIFGCAGGSGLVWCALSYRGVAKRPGSIFGTKNLHVTESFEIRPGNDIFNAANAHRFRAHTVHMDNGLANRVNYRLTGVGPQIMVTGQLSGCSFVIQPVGVGGAIDVAHIKPVGMTGKVLANTLRANQQNTIVYGARASHRYYDSDKRVVSIVGVRTGGVWRVYCQKQDPMGLAYTIRSVYRIYPNRKKI